MDPTRDSTNTEAELESFRRQWREEVTAKAKGKAPAGPSKAVPTASSRPHATKSTVSDATPHAHVRQRSIEHVDELTPYVYHDLGEKKHGRRLDETPAQTAAALTASREPTSALEHYEQAVEKEGQGRLGDSVNLYRRAFKVSRSRCTILKSQPC